MAALTFAVDRRAAVTVLTCHGTLVAAHAMQLETALSQLLLRSQPRIVVDLAQVSAVDCTGVMMLRVTAGIATEQGGSLVLATPGTHILHTLREGGTLSAIPTYRTVQHALDADAEGLITDADVPDSTTPWPMNSDRRNTA